MDVPQADPYWCAAISIRHCRCHREASLSRVSRQMQRPLLPLTRGHNGLIPPGMPAQLAREWLRGDPVGQAA
jgi:hypothetical protein